jgi:hypothetical protein
MRSINPDEPAAVLSATERDDKSRAGLAPLRAKRRRDFCERLRVVTDDSERPSRDGVAEVDDVRLEKMQLATDRSQLVALLRTPTRV